MDYAEQLRGMPAPGNGCHPHLLRIANLGIRAGLAVEQVAADIRAAIPAGKRHVPDREISAAVEKAQREAGQHGGPSRRWSPPAAVSRPRLDADGLRAKIMAEGSPDEVDLWESSPVRLCGLPEDDAVLLLQHFYDPDEFLFLGDTYNKAVQTVEQWVAWIKENGTAQLPHVIPNPVDGEEHETSAGTKSRRCDVAVKSFRFAVVEFDDIPRADQLRFWSGILRRGLLNVACLLDSGGKSVHAWVNVDVTSRADWERNIKQRLFQDWLILFGVDSTTKNPARLSRLPGHKVLRVGLIRDIVFLTGETDCTFLVSGGSDWLGARLTGGQSLVKYQDD